MQGRRASVRMQFNDGSAFDEWLLFELRETYSDPLGEVKFTAAPAAARLPHYFAHLQKGELVSVFVNDVLQGTYLIQTVDTLIDPKSGVALSVVCHSVLITPYQGSVKQPFSFKSTNSPAPVSNVVLDVLRPYGFTNFIGDTAASVDVRTGVPVNGGRKPITVDALKVDQCTAQESETAYQFLARALTRLGVFLRVSPDGTLVAEAPDYEQAPAYTLVQSDDPTIAGDRFFGPIRIHDTNDSQFSECRVRGVQSDKAGQTQTAQPVATVTAAELFPDHPPYKSIGVTGSAAPAGYKPLEIRDKNATSIERCRGVAALALGLRAKEAFVIEGEVAGFVSTTERVWSVGTIVNVQIDAYLPDGRSGFRAPMFVMERVLTRDREGGDRTHLRLIPKGFFTLGDIPGGG